MLKHWEISNNNPENLESLTAFTVICKTRWSHEVARGLSASYHPTACCISQSLTRGGISVCVSDVKDLATSCLCSIFLE